MTNREFLTNVANGTINDEIKAHAAEAIAKLDEANAKRKEKKAENAKPSKAALENAPLVDAAVEFLGTETKIAADIAVALGVSIPKANAVMKQAVAEGKVTVEKIKVPKKGEVNGYTAVAVEADEAEIVED